MNDGMKLPAPRIIPKDSKLQAARFWSLMPDPFWFSVVLKVPVNMDLRPDEPIYITLSAKEPQHTGFHFKSN